jgi:hypothetical protein
MFFYFLPYTYKSSFRTAQAELHLMVRCLWRRCQIKTFLVYFAFWTIYFLKVSEKPTTELIIQCIGIQYSPTCFGTLRCHHQEVKHDPTEIGAQCRGKQRRMGAVYCDRRRDGWDIRTITLPFTCLSRITFDSLMMVF